ncbi:hypothetical protein BGW80DRAFT_688697 [Lactifluus volemus]|nr:hypothetical protein BGW80DRAFT_688697 [Lactifluus volemus]
MGSISAPAPLPRSYDDRAVLQLNPLCDAFFARKLEQRRLDKVQERTWIASIARDVQSNEHSAGVAKRWLQAISASGKQNCRNFALPLNVDTAQLFVHFFWLIYTEDRSRAKNLLAISRRDWGLEGYLYEFTVSKYLESADGPMLSPTGVPNWVPNAIPYNTCRSAARKRSMLGSTSSATTGRLIEVQPSFKKKRLLRKKTRLTIRIKNPAFNRGEGVKSDMNVESPKEAASDRRGITRGNKRKLGHDDSRPPRERAAVLAPRRRSGRRLTVKMSPQLFETPQLVSEPPVECGGSLDHPKCHRPFNEKPNEHDRVPRDTLLKLPGRKRRRKQMPTPLTGLELSVSPPNVTDSAPASTPETRQAVAVPYGPEPDKLSNSSRIPDSATTWPQLNLVLQVLTSERRKSV